MSSNERDHGRCHGADRDSRHPAINGASSQDSRSSNRSGDTGAYRINDHDSNRQQHENRYHENRHDRRGDRNDGDSGDVTRQNLGKDGSRRGSRRHVDDASDITGVRDRRVGGERGGYDRQRGGRRDSYERSDYHQRGGGRGRRGYLIDNEKRSAHHNSSSRDGYYRDADWRCPECSAWNHPRDERCRQCGAFQSLPSRGYDDNGRGRGRTHCRHQHAPHQDEEYQSSVSGKDDDEDDEDADLDEFGRPIVRRSRDSTDSRDKTNQREKQKTAVWPPPFDQRNTTYELDTRSGMFFHAPTNFFYDPQSKYYFGNDTQCYYEYLGPSKGHPPFRKVESSDDNKRKKKKKKRKGTDEGTDGTAPGENGEGRSNKQPKIAISLKTKTLASDAGADGSVKGADVPSSDDKAKDAQGAVVSMQTSSKKVRMRLVRKSDAVKLAPVVTRDEKNTLSNLNRWSERQQEVEKEVVVVVGGTSTMADSNGQTKSPSTILVQHRTVQGLAVCLLCRRKFRTDALYGRHIQESTLHQRNEQKKKDQRQKQQQEQQSYRDRALERRILHNTEEDALLSVPAALSTAPGSTVGLDGNVASPSNAETVAQTLLGSHNIGNQLLQKLGWKSGDGLGNNHTGSNEEADGPNASANPLETDWKRIEHMAAASPATASRRSEQKRRSL